MSIRWSRPKNGGGKKQILRVDLYPGGDALGLRLRNEVASDFLRAFPGTMSRSSKGRTLCTVTGVGNMLNAVAWLAERLKPSGSDGA